jgi:hypothetical protein
MGQTRYFSLAYFDFGDQLDNRINVQKEIDRFVIIDKQLYGLYSVFGNGVIEGWTVQELEGNRENGISVSISEGIGVINYIASETSLPGSINNLPINSIVDIYAVLSGSTSLDRVISFKYSTTPLNSNNVIRIARVSTGENSILYIDNTVRDLIGFEDIIQDAIREHKHRGIPSKIDLENEVKNQLPGARLEGVDASKVTSGQFDIDRIPLIDHNELENNGLLTHAALDSFVQTLSHNNKELLGEVSSVNLMKLILFWKYNYEDVDQFFINELALIPGISPNSFIDFDATSANVNLVEKCISGRPAQTGIFTSVLWNDTFSFNTALSYNNMVIENDTVALDRSDRTDEVVDNFTSGFSNWNSETITNQDSTSTEVVTEDTSRIGRLTSGSAETYYFRRNWSYPDQARNWGGFYDELVIKVKTSDQIHEPVYMYVVNGSNLSSNSDKVFGDIETGDIDGVQKPSVAWTLLAKDEHMSTFSEKVFDISSLELDDVSQITIYTSDKDLVFDIDDIIVRRTNLVSRTGNIRFRYSTEAGVVFHSIFYDVETPEDTNMAVRVKTSSTEEGLLNASWSDSLSSGDVMALSGSYSEIEVVMNSDDLQTLSPILSRLELRILVDADFTGFVIDTENEWNQGTLGNISTNDSIEEGKSYLTISTPININGRYFAKSGSVSEINDNNTGVYGFSGSLMPIAPNQAREWSSSSSRGFNTVSSVVKNFDNSFLVADLKNNRVIKVDSDGNFVKGFGSSYAIDSVFYPLSVVYNPVEQILSVAFTQEVTVNDITKIYFKIGSSKVYLTEDDTVLNNVKAENRILEILLDDDTAVRLVDATSDNLGVDFDDGSFVQDINVPTRMMVANNSIYSTIGGLGCFVGDFTFIDNISHPIFVEETSSNNWIIGNSSIFSEEINTSIEKERTVPSIIEIDPNSVSDVEGKLISNDIIFSDFSLGGIYEYEDDRFIVSGIRERSTSNPSLSLMTGEKLINDYKDAHGSNATIPDNLQFRANAIDTLKEYVGSVVVIDKINNRVQTLYSSSEGLYPSDIGGYSSGDFLVSESSFADSSGRIIKIDDYGNVIWNFGSGSFSVINDVKVLTDNNLIIST